MTKSYQSLKSKVLKDKNIKLEYDALEAEYQVIQALVKLRLSLHLTQDELSKRIGIPKANISRFENGKHSPSLETLVRFAAGLNKKIEIKLIDI